MWQEHIVSIFFVQKRPAEWISTEYIAESAIVSLIAS